MQNCVPFLSNYHMNAHAKVVFNKRHYTLPAWSTSILPDHRNAVYNTARYDEDTATYGDHGIITALGLLEQINVTRDTSDYLWYIISFVLRDF
ncbi:hypothetical protein Bca52824_001751 [Brassica carinata]|uniref:Beta-galactosidase beta-sandwich domain-containing protein n=2 Tax=Brassica carinata TaxID=52824 RepID=A0A8X7WHZ4_BRACI|nr:hypothetical protein Bca52824_001751 [Brassica carinata]